MATEVTALFSHMACGLLGGVCLFRVAKVLTPTHSCCFIILNKKCSLPFIVKGIGRASSSRRLRNF